jgi:uncharacterized protein (UPF0332 family)
MNIDECLREGFLKKARPDRREIQKETEESEKDFRDSGESFRSGKYKWCIIQAYYSMFHSARAVIFSEGYKERRHFAIAVVLEQLANDGELESFFVDDFKSAMFTREEADYDASYSREKAEQVLNIAQEFNSRMKGLLSSLQNKHTKG